MFVLLYCEVCSSKSQFHIWQFSKDMKKSCSELKTNTTPQKWWLEDYLPAFVLFWGAFHLFADFIDQHCRDHYVSPVRHAWEYPSYVYIISILYGYSRYCRTDWVGKTLRQNRKNGIQIRAYQLVKTCKVFSLWFEFPNRDLQRTTPKKTSHI